MAIQDDIPRSRITLKYRTTIQGEPADVELPLRFLVMGDFSRGSNPNDPEDRKAASVSGANIDEVMKSMNLFVELEVPSLVDEGPKTVKIPIEGMHSFSPDSIAMQLPEVRTLLLVRKLLTELQAAMANQKNLRKALKGLSNQDQLAQLVRELEAAGYGGLRLPEPPRKASEADAGAEVAPPPMEHSQPVFFSAEAPDPTPAAPAAPARRRPDHPPLHRSQDLIRSHTHVD
jgi:type VI secretion system protein ImpB